MSDKKEMTAKRGRQSAGFSLIETMAAMFVLTIGVLALAAVLGAGVGYMNTSQQDFIAQQKAQEAVESIFTARDTGALSFPAIQNVGNGTGIFLNGPLALCDAGPDGIVGTADDNCNNEDSIVSPGPDGVLGTADDIVLPLSNFRRTITITNVAANPSLRNISVSVTYNAGRFVRTYTVNTLISAVF